MKQFDSKQEMVNYIHDNFDILKEKAKEDTEAKGIFSKNFFFTKAVLSVYLICFVAIQLMHFSEFNKFKLINVSSELLIIGFCFYFDYFTNKHWSVKNNVWLVNNQSISMGDFLYHTLTFKSAKDKQDWLKEYYPKLSKEIKTYQVENLINFVYIEQKHANKEVGMTEFI